MVEETVEDDEVLEALAVEDGFQVELEVGLGAQVGRGPEQPQQSPVGDDPPEVVGAVEELLDERVRREARPAGGIDPAEFLARTGDVDGWCVGSWAGPVGDPVGEPAELVGARVVLEVVPEHREERDDPDAAGEAGGAVVLGELGEAGLEDGEERERVAVGFSERIAEGTVVGEPEVFRLLAGEGIRLVPELLEEVGREETADEADGAGAWLDGAGSSERGGRHAALSSPACGASRSSSAPPCRL